MSVIISPDELADHIHRGAKTTILSCFWMPGEHAGLKEYRKEHIPTSFFCDPQASLAAAPSSARGRNPLPTKAILERATRRVGITRDRPTVVYDLGRGLMAARAWWTFKWAGIDNVHILDGGLARWNAEEHAVLGGPGGIPRTSDITVETGHMPTATMEDVRESGKLLIDCREYNRFIGRKERFDLRAGHIPGAVNLPDRKVLNADASFLAPDELKKIFDDLGVQDPADVIVYSGSGLHSAQVIAAMHIAGLPGASHYVGGWSQWCAVQDNPVELGATRA